MFQDHYNGFATVGYFSKFLDGIGWLVALILNSIGKIVYTKFSKVISTTLCDLRSNLEEKDLNAELQSEVKRICAAALQENWPEGELVSRIEQTVNDDMASRVETARAKQSRADTKTSNLTHVIMKAVEGDLEYSKMDADDSEVDKQRGKSVPHDIMALLSTAGSKTNPNGHYPVEMLSSGDRAKVRRDANPP